MPLFSCFGIDREYWSGLTPGRLLLGKAGTSLGRGQASAVYGLVASVSCPHRLPQALIATGSGKGPGTSDPKQVCWGPLLCG